MPIILPVLCLFTTAVGAGFVGVMVARKLAHVANETEVAIEIESILGGLVACCACILAMYLALIINKEVPNNPWSLMAICFKAQLAFNIAPSMVMVLVFCKYVVKSAHRCVDNQSRS